MLFQTYLSNHLEVSSVRMTFEIPNSKLQIPNKFQCPISNDQINFFGISDLLIGVYLVLTGKQVLLSNRYGIY